MKTYELNKWYIADCNLFKGYMLFLNEITEDRIIYMGDYIIPEEDIIDKAEIIIGGRFTHIQRLATAEEIAKFGVANYTGSSTRVMLNYSKINITLTEEKPESNKYCSPECEAFVEGYCLAKDITSKQLTSDPEYADQFDMVLAMYDKHVADKIFLRSTQNNSAV